MALCELDDLIAAQLDALLNNPLPVHALRMCMYRKRSEQIAFLMGARYHPHPPRMERFVWPQKAA